jgi:hypothetical protein
MPYFPSPRETLDDVKKRTILALLAGGCSRRSAAHFVGCAPSTITRAATRDPDFDAAVVHAEQSAELKLLRHIQNAGTNPRYWRASAWLLERLNPNDYTVHPNLMTKDQMEQVVAQVCELLYKDIPIENMEHAIEKLQFLLYEQGLLRPVNFDDEPDNNDAPPKNANENLAPSVHPPDDAIDMPATRDPFLS